MSAKATNQDLLYRHTQIDRAAMKAANGKRTLPVCFISETPVLRTENGKKYREVLSLNEGDADLSLLQDGGAFIDEHNFDRQIGSVDHAWIDAADRKGRAVLSFADTDLGNERWNLMAGGHRKDISAGYIHTKLLSETKGADGIPIRRYAAKFFEITSCAVGADHFETGVGRSVNPQHKNKSMSPHIEYNEATELATRAEAFIKDFPHLKNEILTLKARALSEEIKLPEFAKLCFATLEKNPVKRNVFQQVSDHEIGMSRGEIQQYSLHRALQSMAANGGKVQGFEKEVSDEVEKKFNVRSEGFFMPSDVVLGDSRKNLFQRDMTAGDFASGGATKATQILPMIELLRNRTVCNRIGATILSGLTSDVAFPRETSPVTPQSVPEVGLLADSNLTLDQIRLTPHRVGVTVTYSKQLIFQATPDIEGIIRNDAMTQVGIYHDAMFLNGIGAGDQPLGLLNMPGLNQVAFGGAATFSKIVSMETAVGKVNADSGNLAYVTTPGTKGIWKQAAVALAGATTVSSRALWENGNFADGSNDGLVNSYRAASSNQIPNDRVIFGNWQDLVCAYFGGFDIVYDPFTSAKKGQIVTTINTWIDVAARHAQSFTVSTDAGNQ